MAGDSDTTLLVRALRALALLIAVAAIIDPAITSARRTRPLLSVVAADATRDSALLARVTRTLERTYTVLPAPLPAAVGTVLVGDRLPSQAHALALPTVVVTPSAGGPAVAIRSIQAPGRAMLESRVTIAVTLVTRGFAPAPSAIGHSIELELAQGPLVVAHERIPVAHDSVLTVPLTFVPTAEEPVVLQVRAFVSEQSDSARSDLLVDVRTNRWSVLFFDRRPSWMSTFVRRALERDPRFAVTSRIITSTNVSRATGRPPAGLDAIAAAGSFDAVVIGAPDALTSRDVDGINTLLRMRGASVLMLADHAARGPADALFDFGGWRTIARRVPTELSAPASGERAREPLRLKGLSIGMPQRLPPSAVPLAVLRSAATSDSARAAELAPPVIWSVPVGLGRLVVSGAFDAWRFRDTAQSTFDATWRDLIDEAASQRQVPLEVRVSPALATPRAAISLVVTPRDSANASPVSAALRDIGVPEAPPVPLTFETGRGGAQRIAAFRAPVIPGRYETLVVQGPDTVRVPLIVAPHVDRDAYNDPDMMAAWAASRGGRVVARDSLESLNRVLDQVLRPVPRITEWHPMRSSWWIVPFALALAAEWWIRRRRGLA